MHEYYIKFSTILIRTNKKLNACNFSYLYLVIRNYQLNIVWVWMWMYSQAKLLGNSELAILRLVSPSIMIRQTSIHHNKDSLKQIVDLMLFPLLHLRTEHILFYNIHIVLQNVSHSRKDSN